MLVANVPGSLPDDTHGARVIENATPLSYAANLNRGIAETTGELVLVNNPDAVPEPGAVADARRVHGRARRVAGSPARAW